MIKRLVRNTFALLAVSVLAMPVVAQASDPGWLEILPQVEQTKIAVNGVPTLVQRGITKGFSMPIWSDPANKNEELYFQTIVPPQWDEVSDVECHLDLALDTANVNKNFNMQLEWEHTTPGVDILPTTSNTLTVETPTGGAAQWQTFQFSFAVDYDIDVGDELEVEDIIHFRLRRIGATADEIAGEVVVNHIGIHVDRGDQEDLVGDADMELLAFVLLPALLTIVGFNTKNQALAYGAAGGWALLGFFAFGNAVVPWDVNYGLGFFSLLGMTTLCFFMGVQFGLEDEDEVAKGMDTLEPSDDENNQRQKRKTRKREKRSVRRMLRTWRGKG